MCKPPTLVVALRFVLAALVKTILEACKEGKVVSRMFDTVLEWGVVGSTYGLLSLFLFSLGFGLAFLLGGFLLEVLGLLGGHGSEVGVDSLLGPDAGVQLGIVLLKPSATLGSRGTELAVLGRECADRTVGHFARRWDGRRAGF